MFSLVEKIVSYFWKSEDENISNHQDDLNPEELPCLISFLQTEKEEDRVINKGSGIIIINGRITLISGDYCLVEEKYYLDLRKFSFSEVLELGTRIRFSIFRLSENEDWQIHRIFSVGEEDWDEENTSVGMVFGEGQGAVMHSKDAENVGLAQKRTLVDKVYERENRDVILETGGTRFSLDDVESTIVPYNGDWLSLEALVELDEETGDLGGKILKIEKISALRTSLIENGEVTDIGNSYAIVDKMILAHRISFSPGYDASVGDRVVLQAIESDCGAGCSWRALALAPVQVSLQKAITTIERKDLEEDSLVVEEKEGIVVKGDTAFGSLALGCEGVRVIQLYNKGPRMQLLLRSRFHCARSQSQMSVTRLNLNGEHDGDNQEYKPVPIYPGKTLSFEFLCKARFLGDSNELFVFTFRGFRIGCHLKVRGVDNYSQSSFGNDEMQGRDLYKRNNSRGQRGRRPNHNGEIIVPGVRTTKPPAFTPMKLPIFDVPDRLWDAVFGSDDAQQETRKPFSKMLSDVIEAVPSFKSNSENGIALTSQNYKQKFHALLHLEEIELIIRMQQRDLFGVTLRSTGPGGQFITVEVPHLVEKRPSIMIGDRVLISSASKGTFNNYGQSGMKYEGFVHRIFKSEVWLKFNQSFHDTIKHLECGIVTKDNKTEIVEPPKVEWDVSFHFSRTPLRRCHLAVDIALNHLEEDFLFPKKVIKKKPQVYLFEKCENNEKIEDQKRSNFGKFAEKKEFSDSGNNKEFLALLKPKNSENKGERIESGAEVTCNVVSDNKGVTFSSVNGPQSGSNDKSCMNSFNVEDTRKELHDMSSEECVNLSSNSSENICSNSVSPRIPVVERLFKVSSPPRLEQPNLTNDNNCSKQMVINSVSAGSSGSKLKSNNESDESTALPCDSYCNMQETGIPSHRKRSVKWFNKKLNRQQKNAVLNILKGEARPLPYVIFGPPGTGKTVTLVEAILQILHLVPECRIMVATPSNSSADLISERILETVPLNPGELVRLIALHCVEGGKISSTLMPYCTTGICGRLGTNDEDTSGAYNSGPKLRIPMSSSVLGRHRITIGTCVTLGQIYSLGFPKGHFTHVFLDEAGQSTEPESLIPLGFLSTAEIGWGQAVLAGDPRQLGPVVLSKLAFKLGLGQSLLDRILTSSPYEPDPMGFPDKISGHYNPSVVTRLVINYRSVPDLLSLTSDMFYDSSLLPTVSPLYGKEGLLLLKLANYLPLKKCHADLENIKIASPLVFHGVRGEESRNEDSPSWFNSLEAVQCLEYIKIFYRLAGLNQEDIGIITPYVEQVKTIKSLIADHCLPLPKVGTVEEFQGQEHLAILLSCVRTTKTLIHTDIAHSLGFVSSSNRVNVATSRARALLIIIGDPHLLHLDPIWNKLLKRCVESDCYIGCDLPKKFLGNFDKLEDGDQCDFLKKELLAG